MLLTNGRIYTLDGRGTIADTLVVRDGRVAFAGRRADVNAAPGEEIVDLGGRAALPGLVDAHGHLMHLARLRLTLDLRGADSEEDAARRVGERAARLPKGEWISGRNWDQNLWPGARLPYRASLDRAAPDHPAALVRIDGHATWANSAALHAAAITRATRDPEGGLIARDAAGEPTGLLVDTAQRLLHGVEPRPTDEQFDRAVRASVADCLAAGLTGVHEMGAELYALASYRRLLERGGFPFRNYVAVSRRSESTGSYYRERGPESFGPGGRLTVGAVKLMAVGALGSRAYAWRSLLATGVVIAGGYDFPVESPNPFYGLHAAVTRRPRTGDDPHWQPEQRMTREEAVRSFTSWNAYASRQEAELGTLEPGKRADLIVLSEDVFTCPEDHIAEIRPVLTLVGGDIVYRAPA